MKHLLAAILVALLGAVSPAAAETRAVTSSQRIGGATVGSTLAVESGEGRLGVSSGAGVTLDGRRTGVDSSLGVTSGDGTLGVGSTFNVEKNGNRSGVDSSLTVGTGDGSLGVTSEFATHDGTTRRGVRNTLSVGPGATVRTVRTRFAAGVTPATPPAVAKRIAELRAIVDAVLKAEPAHDAWWSSYGFCTDLSGKWLAELERRGQKLALQTTDGNAVRTVAVVDGKLEPVFKYHVFLADPSAGTGENEILFDPSWQQFLKDPGTLGDLPKVFVGTRSAARALFQRLRRNARAEAGDGGDPRAGRYEPTSLVELIYSFGRNAAARVQY